MKCEFERFAPNRVRCVLCGREVTTDNPPERVNAQCRTATRSPSAGIAGTVTDQLVQEKAPCLPCGDRPPSIGVVIPTYNCGPYLEPCLESWKAQTLKPTRLIIVDDGSTDNTREIFARLGLLPAPQSPGMLTRGQNYAAALWRRMRGRKAHPEEITAARLQICNACDSLDPVSRECGECGCPVATKAAWPTEECPRKFWEGGFPIEIISHEINRGANAARQTGLEQLDTEWVILADADAVYRPEFLQRLHAATKDPKNPHADLVYCSWDRIRDGVTSHETRTEFGIVTTAHSERITAQPWNPRSLWWGNYISMCSLVRRTALPRLTPAEPHLDGLDDWQIWLRFASEGRTGIAVPDSLFSAWERPEGKTGTLRADQPGLKRKIAHHRRLHADLVGCREPISIVIPYLNCADLLEQCLEHIRDFCGLPYEIVIVDNGSREPVPGVAGLDPLVIRNPTNRGFTVACNQGLRASPGRHVLLLNSDCFLGPDCVERMCDHLGPQVAAVGPRTGDGGSASLPGKMSAMEGSRATHPRRPPVPVSMVAFFCTLLNRDAIAALGPLDNRPVFESGLGADDEWCHRAHKAGWKILRADDAYAEHVGKQSFLRNRIDRDTLQKPALEEIAKL